MTSRLLSGRRKPGRLVASCAVLLVLIALVALIVPLLLSNDYATTNLDNRLAPPTTSGGHLFGTDELGRDLFARTLLGIQISLFVAVIASIVSLGIGVAYGALAGYVGGKQ